MRENGVNRAGFASSESLLCHLGAVGPQFSQLCNGDIYRLL